MSKLEVDAIEPQSGTTLTLGASGDTVNVASGATNNLGITMADQWRLTADITTDTDPISANLERVDDTGFNYIGTGMSVSSGIWTFPETGIYLVKFNGLMSASGSNDNVFMTASTTINNSTFTEVCTKGASAPSSNLQNNIVGEIFFDVTDTSTHKLQFKVSSLAAGSLLRGDTADNETFFTFIRLGDT